MNLLEILKSLPPHSSANQALYVHAQLVPVIEKKNVDEKLHKTKKITISLNKATRIYFIAHTN